MPLNPDEFILVGITTNCSVTLLPWSSVIVTRVVKITAVPDVVVTIGYGSNTIIATVSLLLSPYVIISLLCKVPVPEVIVVVKVVVEGLSKVVVLSPNLEEIVEGTITTSSVTKLPESSENVDKTVVIDSVPKVIVVVGHGVTTTSTTWVESSSVLVMVV